MQNKTYEYEGKEMSFDCLRLKRAAAAYQKINSINRADMLEAIARDVGVSPSTVENWLRGKNAPVDLDVIEALSDALGLGGKMFLLAEVNRRSGMDRLSERQMTALKRISDKFIEYVSDYVNSEGYDKYYQKYAAEGCDNPREKVFELAESLYNDLLTVYHQEYFDLHGTDIYEKDLRLFIGSHQYYYAGSVRNQIPELIKYDEIKEKDIDMEVYMTYESDMDALRAIMTKYTG